MGKCFNLLLIGCMQILLLGGCANTYTLSECIQTTEITDYAPNLSRSNDNYVLRKSMPNWWKPLINKSQKQSIPYPAHDILVRSDNVIWIAFDTDDSGNAIIKYQTDTGEINFYGVQAPNDAGFNADDLFISKDGTLWARLSAMSPGYGFSVLAKYDPNKDEFVVVTDQDGLLTPVTNGRFHAIDRGLSVLSETPDNKLAIIIDGQMYLYNPSTNEAEIIIGIDKGLDVQSIDVSKEGHIWFVTNTDYSIREIDPSTGFIWDHGPPPDFSEEVNDPNPLTTAHNAIEIDNDGRVWIADYGWLEPNDQPSRYSWHSLSRSPIFISPYDRDIKYIWRRPTSVSQLSDGNIWYGSFVGVVQYNIQANEWCLKGPEPGMFAEDGKGHVYFISDLDRQIYRYLIQP